MTAPIPLAAPDGTVYAWACPVCWRVYGGGRRQRAPDGTTYGAGYQDAETCCDDSEVRCVHGWHLFACRDCLRDGRRAFVMLAAIGMAVSAGALLLRAYDNACAVGDEGIQFAPSTFDDLTEAAQAYDEETAALCGVDVETVRGWSRG